jgi:hypothetical protein
MKREGYLLSMGEIRNASKISVGTLVGKVLLGEPSRRYGDNIKYFRVFAK